MPPIVHRKQGRPTREEAAAIADTILVGARNVFGAQGYVASSMDDIANEIGVSKLTIYRRYSSKEALLEAVVDHDLADLADMLENSGLDGDGELGSLYQMALTLFLHSIKPERIQFVGLLIQESCHNARFRERFSNWEEIIRAPIVARIVAAQSSGAMRGGDPIMIASMLLDLLEGAPKRIRHCRADVFADITPEEYFRTRWEFFERAMTISQSIPQPSPQPVLRKKVQPVA